MGGATCVHAGGLPATNIVQLAQYLSPRGWSWYPTLACDFSLRTVWSSIAFVKLIDMLHPIADPMAVGVLANATIHQNLAVEREGDRLLHAVHVHPTEADAQVVDVDDDATWAVGGGQVGGAFLVAVDDDRLRNGHG